MLIRGVIFDMDGLMLDTEPLYRASWRQAALECGYDLTEAIHDRFVGRNRKDSEQVLVDTFGPEFPLEKFRATVRQCEDRAFSGPVSKKPGLEQLLSFLEARQVPKAVATSTDRRIALHLLAATELLGRFSAVATGDEVANGKPSPDLFLLAAERLGVEPAACLVLEDSDTGVAAAHRAGMGVYIVPDLLPPSAAAEGMAQGTFRSLSDVAQHLESACESRSTDGIDLNVLPKS